MITDGFSTPPPPPSEDEILAMQIAALKKSAEEKKSQKKLEKYATLETLLENSFVVGELHYHFTPKKFLIQNMPSFASAGYKVLFMEHLGPELISELEEYYEITDENPRPKTPDQLRNFLSQQNQGHYAFSVSSNQHRSEKSKEQNPREECNYLFDSVVRAARDNNIKIVPLEVSNENYRGHKSEENYKKRMIYLNHNAKVVIENAQKKFKEENPTEEFKWIAFVGSAHLFDFSGVPGICQALGAQDVLITDSDNMTYKDSRQFSPQIFERKSKSEIATDVPLADSVSLAITTSVLNQSMKIEDLIAFRNKLKIAKNLDEKFHSITSSSTFSSSSANYENKPSKAPKRLFLAEDEVRELEKLKKKRPQENENNI